jgi:hypothetical protein
MFQQGFQIWIRPLGRREAPGREAALGFLRKKIPDWRHILWYQSIDSPVSHGDCG